MAALSANNIIKNTKVYQVLENGEYDPKFVDPPVTIKLEYHPQGVALLCFDAQSGEKSNFECLIEKSCPPLRLGRSAFIVSTESSGNLLLRIQEENDATNFHILVTKALKGHETSMFTERTEDSSALQYFQFYGYLSQQQNMMQDYIRTATYQRAILSNVNDFLDKVVLDVGAGSGILSFFALQAGAKKVYAVEASSMAMHAETLANANGMRGKLIVLPGKIEEIQLSEPVDTIISEPMGYMLYNERMLETFLHAKKWLKPDGKMFPSRGDLHVAPFTDDALYLEQCGKANFWMANCFHGVDLSSLRNAALKEYFRQPIVDTFDVRICLAKSVKHTVDFHTASEFDLHRIEIPFEFQMLETGTIHGLAFWFDVSFDGSNQTIWLSTAPTEPLTHWYQVRCLVETPLMAKQGQILKGQVLLLANKRQSYDVQIDMEIDGKKANNVLDLKNPYFRYTGQPTQPPPGNHTTAPSDNIWTVLTDTNAVQTPQAILPQVNGIAGVALNGIDQSNLVFAQQTIPDPTNSVEFPPGGCFILPTNTIPTMQPAGSNITLTSANPATGIQWVSNSNNRL